MKNESDNALQEQVAQKLRETPEKDKPYLFQQMRKWPQEVLMRLVAGLDGDAWT